MIAVYLTPLDDLGGFGEEVEITSDVELSSVGKIRRALDNSTYDIGILRYNSLNLKLFNSQGKYSDIDNLNSIFRYRRSGSKIRITWAPGPPLYCGMFNCGEAILSEEVTIYRGIINDDAAKMAIDEQIIELAVLSYDSQFSKILVPFSSLVLGDSLKEILFKILNQTAVTDYLTVDVDNFEFEIDYDPDDLAWFENRTGKEAIEKILLAANSVIFIEDDVLYTSSRAPSAEVEKTFYGQASQIGNENILNMQDFRWGHNRVINLVRWKDGAASSDPFSVERWGASPKDIDAEFVTNLTNQESTAASIVTEFKNPKKEFTLSTPLDVDAVGLSFLDRVNADYPTVVQAAGRFLPIVGLTEIGDIQSPLPKTLWDFKLDTEEHFKIMSIDIDPKSEIISFGLRGV